MHVKIYFNYVETYAMQIYVVLEKYEAPCKN